MKDNFSSVSASAGPIGARLCRDFAPRCRDWLKLCAVIVSVMLLHCMPAHH